ncbi:hypothetical protein MKEN_00024900 [Mycena kentingensis (nom. inval.)]|nr:hypothetical protein MKEN_00024900 [Mycena kentingensis (nom. inval.)]
MAQPTDDAAPSPTPTPTPAATLRKAVPRYRTYKAVALVIIAAWLAFAFTHRPAWLRYRRPRRDRAVGDVEWLHSMRCSPGTVCGSIIVPKDYFNASAGTASIAIAVRRATKTPKKGTVFLNPGGPGGSGVALATEGFANLIGHDWDILGFDPRGVNGSFPQVACFESMSAANLFTANTILENSFTIPSSNLSDSEVRAAVRTELTAQAREYIAVTKAQAKICAERMGEEVRYMGTATVVRDMDFIVRILDGEDAKINFWGGSYGSIMGEYLVNMLPDRVGHVVIDGIMDPVNWSSEPSYKYTVNWLSSIEKTYKFYLQQCSQAGPSRCPLAKYTNEPYESIMARIETFLDQLALEALPVLGDAVARQGVLTSGGVRATLLIYLQVPAWWSISAKALASAMAGDATVLYNLLLSRTSARRSNAPNPHYDLARLAVSCMDSLPPAVNLEPTPDDLAEELLHMLESVSPHFGANVFISEPDGGCQFWPRGPERFTGPWNASLEVPMLIVSNTMDPITPIENGLLVNSMMPESSRLIIQDGPGHVSLSMPTLCTQKLIRGYFAGDIPANGTTCETEYSYFPSKSPMALDTEQGSAAAQIPLQVLSAEDVVLLESAKTVGELLQAIRLGW